MVAVAVEEYERVAEAVREHELTDRPGKRDKRCRRLLGRRSSREASSSFAGGRGSSRNLRGEADDLQTLSLSCISDDAQGERLEVLWDAEIGAVVLDEDGWRNVGHGAP